MAEGWEPDEASLRLPLLTTGLAMAEITPEVVAEFVAHWPTQPSRTPMPAGASVWSST